MTTKGYYSPQEYQQAISQSSGVQSAGRITQPTLIEDEEESQFSFKPVSLQPTPEPRLPVQGSDQPGMFSRAISSAPAQALGAAFTAIDTPISERIGFKVPEMRGPFDEIGNIVLQEATRPTNLLFAIPGYGASNVLRRGAATALRPFFRRAAPTAAKFGVSAIEPLGTWAGSPIYRAAAEVAGAGVIRGVSDFAVSRLDDDAPLWQKLGAGLGAGLITGVPTAKYLASLPRRYAKLTDQAKLGTEWAKRQKVALRHPSQQFAADFSEGIDDFVDKVAADSENYKFDIDPGNGLVRLKVDDSVQPDIREILTPEELEQFRQFEGTKDFEISPEEFDAGEIRPDRQFIEQEMSGAPDTIVTPIGDAPEGSKAFFMSNKETGQISGGIEMDPDGNIRFWAIPADPAKVDLQQKVELLGDLDTKRPVRSPELLPEIKELDPETRMGITGYGAGVKLLLRAVEEGARTITVLDGPMLRVAHAFGFEPVGFVKYTDAYDDAARQKIDPAADAFEPDVVVMAYTGGQRTGALDGTGKNSALRYRIDDFGDVRQTTNQFQTLEDAIGAGQEISDLSEITGRRLADFWNLPEYAEDVLGFTERFDNKTLSGPITAPFRGKPKNIPPDISKILDDEFARVRLDPLGNNTILSLPVRGIGTDAGLVKLEDATWERFVLDNKTGQLYPEKFYLDEGRGTYIEQKLGISGNEAGRTDDIINRMTLNIRFWQNMQSPEPEPLNGIQARLVSLFGGHLGEVYDPDAAAVALRWANVDEALNSHTAIFYKSVEDKMETSGLNDVLEVQNVPRGTDDGVSVPMIGMQVPANVIKRQRVELPDGSFMENVPVYDLFAVDENGKRFLTDDQIEGLREILLGELGYLRGAEEKVLPNSGQSVTGLSAAEAAQISEAAGSELKDDQFVNFFDLMEHSNLLATPDGTAQLGVYVPRDFVILANDEVSRAAGIMNNSNFMRRSGRLGVVNRVDVDGNPVPMMPGTHDNEFQFLVNELIKEQGGIEFQTSLPLILATRYKAGAQALNAYRFNQKIREFGLNAFQYIEEKNPEILAAPSRWSRTINSIEKQIDDRESRRKELKGSVRNAKPLIRNIYRNVERLRERVKQTGEVSGVEILTVKQSIMRDLKLIAKISGMLRAQQAMGVKLRNKQRVQEVLLYGTPEQADEALANFEARFDEVDFDQITTVDQFKEWELLAKEMFDDQYAINPEGIPIEGTKTFKEVAGIINELEAHVTQIYRIQREILKKFDEFGLGIPARLSTPLDVSPRRQAAQRAIEVDIDTKLTRYTDADGHWQEPEDIQEFELEAFRSFRGTEEQPGHGSSAQLARDLRIPKELLDRPGVLDRDWHQRGRALRPESSVPEGEPSMPMEYPLEGEPPAGIEMPDVSIDAVRIAAFEQKVKEEAIRANMSEEEYRALMVAEAEAADDIPTTFSPNQIEQARQIENTPERREAMNALIWELDDLNRLKQTLDRPLDTYRTRSYNPLNTSFDTPAEKLRRAPTDEEVKNSDYYWFLHKKGDNLVWFKPVFNEELGINEWVDAGSGADVPQKLISSLERQGDVGNWGRPNEYPVAEIPTDNLDIGPAYSPDLRRGVDGGMGKSTPRYRQFKADTEKEILEEMGYDFPLTGPGTRNREFHRRYGWGFTDLQRKGRADAAMRGELDDYEGQSYNRGDGTTWEDQLELNPGELRPEPELRGRPHRIPRPGDEPLTIQEAFENDQWQQSWKAQRAWDRERSRRVFPKKTTVRVVRQAIDRAANKIDAADRALRQIGTSYVEFMTAQSNSGAAWVTRQDILNKEIDEWLPTDEQLSWLLGPNWQARVVQPATDSAERLVETLENLTREYAQIMRQAERASRQLDNLNRKVSANQIAKSTKEAGRTDAEARIKANVTTLLMMQRQRASGDVLNRELAIQETTGRVAKRLEDRFKARDTALDKEIKALEGERERAIHGYHAAQNTLDAEIAHYNQLDNLSDMTGLATTFDRSTRTMPSVAKQFDATPAMKSAPRPLFGGTGEHIAALNAEMRAASATLDMSATTIQGLFAMGTHPIEAAKAWWMVTGAWVRNPEMRRQWYEENAAEISRMIRRGLVWIDASGNEEYLLQSNTPVFSKIGKVMDRTAVTKWISSTLASGRDFSNWHFAETGNLMRFVMAKKLEQGDFVMRMAAKADGRKLEPLTEDQWRKRIEVINNATGMASGYKPSSAAQMALFAPRFFRSQLRMVRDAAFRSDEAGQLARRYILTTMMTAVTLTTALNEVRGESTDYNIWKINERTGEAYYNTNALKIKNIGGRDISLLGVYDSLLGIIVTGKVEGPESSAVRTLRTKASPGVGRLWDAFSGTDFAGNEVIVQPVKDPIQTMQTAARMGANSYTPFFVGDVAEDVARGTAGAQSPFVMAGAFLGMKASPMTPNERRNYQVTKWVDELGPEQKQELGLLFRNQFNAMESVPVSEYRDLTGAAKSRFNQEFPLYDDLNIESLQKRARRGDEGALAQLNKILIEDIAMEEQAALADAYVKWLNNEPNMQGMVVPMDPAKIMSDLTDIRYRAWKAKKAQDRFFDQETSDPVSDDPVQRALSQYYQAMDNNTIPGTNHVNWNQFNRDLAKLHREWSPAQANAIENRSPAKIHPTFQELWDDRQLVNQSAYYDVAQQIYERPIVQQALTALMGEDVPLYYDGFTDLIEAMFADPNIERQQMAFILSRLNGKLVPAIQNQRKQLIAEQPEIGEALQRLGRIRPNRQQVMQVA